MYQIILRVVIVVAGVWTLQAGAQQEVDIALEQFGLASHYRPGDVTGIKLRLTSNLQETRNVQVVLEAPEAVGDIAEYMRRLALGQGQVVSVWMYARLLPGATNETLYTVRVYEDNDGARGRELGATRIQASIAPGGTTAVPIVHQMGAIVGGINDAAIEQYNATTTNRFPDTGHAFISLVRGVSIDELPDRWEGYDSFEFIVWTDASPGALAGSPKASALMNWIRRGGHLVIVLPQSGNNWGMGTLPVNEISTLLPEVSPPTVELSMRELLPVLTKREQIPERANIPFSVRVFEQFTEPWSPLIALPDERTIAVDRRYGFGRITLLGIDVTSPSLNNLKPDRGAPVLEAGPIWNLIFGRRQDTLTREQLTALSDDRNLSVNRRTIDLGRGATITQQTSLSGAAMQGIGLAFVLFVVYWLVAGPAGFAMLKTTKRVQHAWVAFALTSVVFTVIAWIAVKLLSQKDTQLRHLTFLDYVAQSSTVPGTDDDSLDPGVHRASSWFTVFLPGYGTTDVELVSDAADRNLLLPFAAPGVNINEFTNVDRYVIPIDSPDSYSIPVRATTKDLHARWVGRLDESTWKGGFEITEPLDYQNGFLRAGRISHNFPGTLRNVRIILVEPGRTAPKEYIDEIGVDPRLRNVAQVGAMPYAVQAYSPGTVPPLTEISFANLGSPQPFARAIDDAYRSVKNVDNVIGGGGVGFRADTYFFLLSFYNMITPPEYRAALGADDRDQPHTVERWIAHDIDISDWLTRPCVIVYGQLEGVPVPYGVRFDDVAPQSRGTVIVRWIHPLPVDPSGVATPLPQSNPPESDS